jgi:hypothetical protein
MTLGPERHLTLAEVMERQKTHWLRQAEVPIEHYVSIPLPTTRWAGAGYACYAAPALRRRGEPTSVSPPTHWWVVAANGGHLVVYALYAAVPYAQDLPAGPEIMRAPAGSIAEIKDQIAEIGELAEKLVPQFFAGQPGDADRRLRLAALLQSHMPGRVGEWQRALTPEFWAFLEA